MKRDARLTMHSLALNIIVALIVGDKEAEIIVWMLNAFDFIIISDAISMICVNGLLISATR